VAVLSVAEADALAQFHWVELKRKAERSTSLQTWRAEEAITRDRG